MPYQPISKLLQLYNQKMTTLSGTYNPNAGAISLGKASPTVVNPVNPVKPVVKSAAKPVNNGLIGTALNTMGTKLTPGISAGPNSLSVGVKTKSPTDNIKTPPNTTNQPKVVTPASNSSTANGTLGTREASTVASPPVMGAAPVTPVTPPPTFTPETPATPTTNGTPSPYQPTDAGLYGKLIAAMANRSTQSGEDYKASQAEANRIAEERAKLSQEYAQKTNNIAGTAGFLTQQAGLQGQLQNQYNMGQSALSSQEASATSRLGAANTQQGLLQSLLQSAASGASPTSNIVNVNPITGQPVGGGSLGSLANLAGQVQGIQSGAAAKAAVGGNVAAQNETALGTAGTTANAKAIQDFTTQVNTTQKSIDTLHGIQVPLIPNIGTTGFNPTSSPVGNDTFSKYFTEKNPAAAAGIRAGFAEMKNQISNVIASATGLTPTGVTGEVNSYNFEDLNPQQLNDFLLYIDKFAKSNMEAANNNITRIKSGGAVDSNKGALPTPEANSTLQAAVGTGGKLAEGLISKIGSSLGTFVAGAVTEGLASKLLH